MYFQVLDQAEWRSNNTKYLEIGIRKKEHKRISNIDTPINDFTWYIKEYKILFISTTLG